MVSREGPPEPRSPRGPGDSREIVTRVKETRFMSLRLNINGEDQLSVNDPLTPLVDVLRDEFFLTGTKVVCREGFCGACTVLLDGRPVASCLVPVGLAAHCEVSTVESLARDGALSPLQRAMEEHDVVQCG